MKLVLPYPPSVNHCYKNVYRKTTKGKRYTARVLTDASQKWYDDAVVLLRRQMHQQGWVTLNEKTVIDVYVFFPDKRKRDASNVLKVMLDAMEDAGVYTNDRWALPRIMDFHVCAERTGRVEMEVYKF